MVSVVCIWVCWVELSYYVGLEVTGGQHCIIGSSLLNSLANIEPIVFISIVTYCANAIGKDMANVIWVAHVQLSEVVPMTRYACILFYTIVPR